DASVFGDEHSLHQSDIAAEHRALADHRSNPEDAAVADTRALSDDHVMCRLHVGSEDHIFVDNGSSANDAAFADPGAGTAGEIAVRKESVLGGMADNDIRIDQRVGVNFAGANKASQFAISDQHRSPNSRRKHRLSSQESRHKSWANARSSSVAAGHFDRTSPTLRPPACKRTTGSGPMLDGSTPIWPAEGAFTGETGMSPSASAARSTSPQNWATIACFQYVPMRKASSLPITGAPFGRNATRIAS